ncbi:hypothetical protein [Actinokineospora sp. NBRC 105648]|uniref:hypothetical protein n=1 Tax=Actinokineospora sp. NBRC 105648 TaxID=3032206 RepID=UPI0024A11F95|nr:hypothetical protein [Actinokineospora sp. NBRC 105648]GLZ37682.1 hypothetical protein Acsp05_13070 [Actinokineospora sp. NBRC 105648]
MPTYGEVRTWQSGPLDEAEQQLKARSDSLLGLADELDASAKPAGWHGLAADGAMAERGRVTDRMEHLVAGVNAARSALMVAADRVIELRNLVSDTEGVASAHRFAIDHSGSVVDHGPPPETPANQREAVQAERNRIRTELVDRVGQIMRYANDIDGTLAGVLDQVAQGKISDGGATTLADAAKAGEPLGIPGAPPKPPTDAGAGKHGVDPWYTTADDRLMHGLAGTAADGAETLGMTHAAANLRHYLGNSGDPMTVNPDEMTRDVSGFRTQVDKTTAAEMRRLAAEAAANGTYGKPVQFSTGWKGHYITKSASQDWFYAMGGVQYAVTGVATVHPPDHPGGEPRVDVQYQTHVFDRYNWDGGKSTTIGPITITDESMAEMHRAGVAQEYDISGTGGVKHYTGPVPAAGELPPPPDNRDGQRGDPGRSRR